MRFKKGSKHAKPTESIMQDGKYCFLCGRMGSPDDPLDMHHIYHGSLRDKSEQYGLWVYLCHNRCHITGQYAVHNNAETDLWLKQEAQKKLMAKRGWTTVKFRQVFYKNYLDEEI